VSSLIGRARELEQTAAGLGQARVVTALSSRDPRRGNFGLNARFSTIRRRGGRKSTVYNHIMGLFRSRARKNREKAAAELLKEQTRTVEAQEQVARRKVTAEERPNPDQPGWGRAIGQEIGKARERRASQE
jgi:hypothetical protein